MDGSLSPRLEPGGPAVTDVLHGVASQTRAQRQRDQSSQPPIAGLGQHAYRHQDKQETRQAQAGYQDKHSTIAERLRGFWTEQLDKYHDVLYSKVRQVITLLSATIGILPHQMYPQVAATLSPTPKGFSLELDISGTGDRLIATCRASSNDDIPGTRNASRHRRRDVSGDIARAGH